MTTLTLFDGRRQVPDLSGSRALHYGDGIFRTCLIYDSQVIDLQGQLSVARQDAGRLGLGGIDWRAVRSEAVELASRVDRAVLKMVLFRSGEVRGYRPDRQGSHRLLRVSPLPDFPARHWRRGIHAVKATLRLAAQPRLAGVKHLNRLEHVLAASEAGNADEALLSDAQGRPICGSRSNLFWIRGRVLSTPRLDRCGVAGRMRERILLAAPGVGLRPREVRGSWRAVLESDESFVCNSLIGIWPLRRLDSHHWPLPGAATQALARALAHPLTVSKTLK